MKNKPKKHLKGKKLKFCHYYGHHENATLAAKQAGYSEKTAHVKGCNLLKEPLIAEMIEILQCDRMARLEVTGEKIIKELAKIAFTDTTEIQGLERGQISAEDFDKLTPEQRACIASVKRTKEGVEVKFHDKIAALTKLGQSQKLFTDVQENKHTFNKMGDVMVDGKPLAFDIGRDPDELVN